MFKENDKFLKTATTLLKVLVFLVSLIGAIFFFVLLFENVITGLIIMLASFFVSYLLWVFGGLWLSYICDVKLIRNKLYDVDNNDLNIFN